MAIAWACLGFVTFCPDELFSSPFEYSRMTVATLACPLEVVGAGGCFAMGDRVVEYLYCLMHFASDAVVWARE
jgi:hypothetical protein